MAPARNPENSALRPSVAQKLNRRCNPVATRGPISQYDRAGSCLALSRWLRSNVRNLLIPVKAMISQLHYFLPSSAPFFLGDTVDDEIPDLLVSKADNSESRFFCQKEANLQWTVWTASPTDLPASADVNWSDARPIAQVRPLPCDADLFAWAGGRCAPAAARARNAKGLGSTRLAGCRPGNFAPVFLAPSSAKGCHPFRPE